MAISKDAEKLKELINKAIESHIISRDEYDNILHIASKDGHIDKQEEALLAQLHDMIEDKLIKFAKS